MGKLYDKEEIFKRSKRLARDKKLLFIQDIVDFLPLSITTFYEYFPAESEESEALKDILAENKISIKTSLRAKWYKSNSATLQMALYKLTSNDEEHRKLQQRYNKNETDITTGGKPFNVKSLVGFEEE